MRFFHSKKKSIFQKNFSVLENGSFFEKSVLWVFSPSFHEKKPFFGFRKFGPKIAFAKIFSEKWPKIGKNRLCFDFPTTSKITKIDSPLGKVRGIASVQQSKFLKISRWARKTHLQAPILFPRRVTGKMKIFGRKKKIFFSEKFFFDRKVQKKWVFKKGIFGPFGAHLGELERFWVFGHFLGRF